jgi:hypothetical protein
MVGGTEVLGRVFTEEVGRIPGVISAICILTKANTRRWWW